MQFWEFTTILIHLLLVPISILIDFQNQCSLPILASNRLIKSTKDLSAELLVRLWGMRPRSERRLLEDEDVWTHRASIIYIAHWPASRHMHEKTFQEEEEILRDIKLMVIHLLRRSDKILVCTGDFGCLVVCMLV